MLGDFRKDFFHLCSNAFFERRDGIVEQRKILLLDCNPAYDLDVTLRGIFESPASPNEKLLYESIHVFEPNVPVRNLSKAVTDFDPDVLLFFLSHALLEKSCNLFQSMRKECMEIPILLIVDEYQPDEMFDLLKLGADDFIALPLRAMDIFPRIWRLLRYKHHEDTLTYKLKERLGLKQLVGESHAFVTEVKKIPIIAKGSASILILGETGTGKEVCARAIHYLSPREGHPFIPVNCGAIPVELVENELFGHASGAFTSANSSQRGLIQEAEGGTLFLDEIDCLPLLAQTKFLRFLQEKEYRPLGSNKICKVDVRIIAATNISLEEAVKTGKFRNDLYYRLNIISFKLPPLRERREDIPLLAQHFLHKYATEYDKQASAFSSDAIQQLMFFDWPGNVRELEHVIERAVVLSDQKIIQKADIVLPGIESSVHQESFQEAKDRVVAQFESAYIQSLLLAHQGNITKAAQAAKKNRRAFWQLIQKHHINPQIYKSHRS